MRSVLCCFLAAILLLCLPVAAIAMTEEQVTVVYYGNLMRLL